LTSFHGNQVSGLVGDGPSRTVLGASLHRGGTHPVHGSNVRCFTSSRNVSRSTERTFSYCTRGCTNCS
jgi:hypothetical protein